MVRIKQLLIGAALTITIFAIIVGLAYIGCFLSIENQQWLKSPDVHYDWWHFILFWDNAYVWLWYHNMTLWLIITGIYASVLTFIIVLLIAAEFG